MYKIKLLNKISQAGLYEFDRQKYVVSEDVENPDAIIVRSASMHDMKIQDTVFAIARAGAGVNNIPVDELTKRGIVVFNTPGANANAVKELVIAGLLLASRKIVDGIEWTRSLVNEGDKLPEIVESGKSKFSGPELEGKRLGVLGLGAIGVLVANTANSLGMEVYGYDPYISVDAAWGLSRSVKKAQSLKTIFQECDYITLHVPLNSETREMLNSEAFSLMKRGMRILNFSRGELVNLDDLQNAIELGYVARYVTDFPNEKVLKIPKTVVTPHLGASTPESENNCAVMAAREIINYLEQGIICNSVNFPNMDSPMMSKVRICLFHKNMPKMISQITSILAQSDINIENLSNKSRGEYACTFVDIDHDIPDSIITGLRKIESVVFVRKII